MALIKSDSIEIVYQRSSRLRWFASLFVVLFIAMFGYLAMAMFPSKQYMYARSPFEIVSRASSVLFVLAGLLPILIGLYAAGSDDLILDLKRRTYRFRRGFPWQRKWWEGSFDDIECLYTKEYQAKNSICQMLLGWKGTGGEDRFAFGDGDLQHRKDVLLGSAPSMPEAFEQIRAIAGRMGVPAENGLQPERKARNQRSAQRLFNRVSPLTFGTVALFFLLMGGPDLLVERLLDSQGHTTPGTITAKHYGSHSTSVGLRYMVKNVPYITTNRIPASADTSVNVGDSVTVTYLPDYPRTARITQSNEGREARGDLAVSGITLLIGLLILLLNSKKG
jgi:hypothetical protein